VQNEVTMLVRGRLAAAWGVATLMAFSAPAWAVPPVVHHEGLLLDEVGLPLNGEVSIRFTIYDAAADGSAMWSEEKDLLLVQGYYTTRLGEDESLEGLFEQGDTWLGIAIDGAPDLEPLQRLASVPYAFVAGNVVGDITPRSITVGGAVVIDDTGNWVGPGVDASRLNGLHSSQLLRLDDDAPARLLELLAGVHGAGSGLDADALDGLDSSKFMRVDENTGTRGDLTVDGLLLAGDVRMDAGARLAVGVDDPQAAIDLLGGLRLRPLGQEPADPVAGVVYFDASTASFRGY